MALHNFVAMVMTGCVHVSYPSLGIHGEVVMKTNAVYFAWLRGYYFTNNVNMNIISILFVTMNMTSLPLYWKQSESFHAVIATVCCHLANTLLSTHISNPASISRPSVTLETCNGELEIA